MSSATTDNDLAQGQSKEAAKPASKCMLLALPPELRLDIFELIIKEDPPTVVTLYAANLSAVGAMTALSATSTQLRRETGHVVAQLAKQEATNFRAVVVDYDFTSLQALITSLAPLPNNISRAFRITLHFTSITTAPDPNLVEAWLEFLAQGRATLPSVSRKYRVSFDSSGLRARSTICGRSQLLLEVGHGSASRSGGSDRGRIAHEIESALACLQFEQRGLRAAARRARD